MKDCISGKRRFVQFESTVTHKSGRTVDIFINASAAVFEGQPAAIGVVIDISARKQAETALRTSESKYANALKIIDAADWEYDVLADRFIFNENFYRIFRTTAEAVGGYTMNSAEYARRFVHPDDREIVGAEVKAAIETNDPDFSRTLEHRTVYGDGTTGWISVRFFITKDQAGRTIKTNGVNQDITKQKEAEVEIINLSRFPQENPNPVLRFSPGGTITFANMSAQPLLNLWGRAVGQLLPDDWVAIASEVLSSGVSKAVEVTCGERVYSVTLSANPAADFVNAYGLDITQRKEGEQALAASELKLHTALSNMSQGLVMLDAEGRLTLFNSRHAEMYGLPHDQIQMGMTVAELMALVGSNSGVRDLDPEGTFAEVDKVIRGGEGGIYIQNLSDGRSIAATYRPMPDGGLLVTFEDITQRKLAEQALTASEAKLQGRTVEHDAGPGDARCKGQDDLVQSSLRRDFRAAARREPAGHDHTGAFGACSFTLGCPPCGPRGWARSD